MVRVLVGVKRVINYAVKVCTDISFKEYYFHNLTSTRTIVCCDNGHHMR